MKQDWEFKKLGDVCTVVGGSTPKTNIPEYWGGENYWVTPAELTGEKYIESTERTITDEAVAKTNLTLLPVGTVLLSSRAPIGKVCITRSLMYCNQGFKNIVCSKCLYNEYVYWWLKGKTDYLNSLGVGATFKEISKRTVEQIVIPVPPLEEQSRIVAELDLLTGIIDKQNAQLKELDTLAQSIFYDMFGDPIENPKGWEVKKFCDVCEVTSSKRVYQSEWQSSGIPFLRISDFSQLIENNDNVDAELFISKEKYDELKLNDQVPSAGEILVTARGTLGVCYIVKKNDCFYFQDGMITWLKNLANQVNPLFVVFLFKNQSFRRQIDKSQSGSTVAYLSISMLKKFILPLPSLALQQEFADKIQSIENQKAKIKTSIADTQKLLDYTMDKYFG